LFLYLEHHTIEAYMGVGGEDPQIIDLSGRYGMRTFIALTQQPQFNPVHVSTAWM